MGGCGNVTRWGGPERSAQAVDTSGVTEHDATPPAVGFDHLVAPNVTVPLPISHDYRQLRSLRLEWVHPTVDRASAEQCPFARLIADSRVHGHMLSTDGCPPTTLQEHDFGTSHPINGH